MTLYKKLINAFFLLSMGILASCGKSNACDQTMVADDMTSVFESGLYAANLDMIWELYIKKKFKITVTDIKEFSVSKNKKIHYCSAKFRMEMPNLNAKIPDAHGFVRGTVLGAKPRYINDINDSRKIIDVEIPYYVASVKKSSNGRDIEIKFNLENAENYDAAVFRIIQIIGTEILREQPNKQPNMIWNKNDFKLLKSFINNEKSLTDKERKIRVCTIENLSKKTYFESYISYLTLNNIIAKDFRSQIGASTDPKFQFWIKLTNQARIDCGDIQPYDLKKNNASSETIIPNDSALTRQKAMTEEAAAIARIVDEYKARITAKIRRNIVMPPDIPYNAVAEFDITLLPGGAISNLQLVKPSGSAIYDLAVERAIKKSQPLPLPPDPALFIKFSELHLKVNPKE